MSNVQSELDSVRRRLADHEARLQQVRDGMKEAKVSNDTEALKELGEKENILQDWITELRVKENRLSNQLGLPAGGPAAEVPVDGPAAEVPAGGPAAELPAGGPAAAEVPAGGPAAELPVGGPGVAGYIRTTAQILNSNLPTMFWELSRGTSSSGGGGRYYVPYNVEMLKCVRGQQDVTQEWEQEVISLQDNPAVELWAKALDDDFVTRTSNEAGIGASLHQPLDLLAKICNRTDSQLPKVDGWMTEQSSTVLQQSVAHHTMQQPNNPVHNGLNRPTTNSLDGSSTICPTFRTDVVLVKRQEQQPLSQAQQQQAPQAQQQQPPPCTSLGNGPPVAIGQYTKPTILACPVGPFDPNIGTDKWHPIKLMDAFLSKDPNAVHVVCQVYTYLLLYGLQYGFISCYYWTWVVQVSKDRRTMYISAPIAHSTKSTSLEPSVTFMGAVHWVQVNGLRTCHEQVDYIDLDSLKTVEELLVEHPQSQDPLPAPPSDVPDNSDYDPGTGPGMSSRGKDDRHSVKRRKGDDGASFSNPCIDGHDGSGSQLQGGMRHNKRMQLSTAPDLLQLRGLICSGGLGLVMHGNLNGQPAVIKLYGPDSAGLAACRNEASVCGALRTLQGRVVPQLLGWGHLLAGVYYLATALVDGTPLSSLSSSRQPLAAAAAAVQSALQKICSVQPGFLHGDLRLANILLLNGTQDAATPTAMFIDFATSRLNGSRAEVRGQRRQLRSLLSRIS